MNVIDKIEIFSDERGNLFPVNLDVLPFDVKRMFFITHAKKDTIRGGHAHKVCMQYYICLKGIIEITYIENNKEDVFFLGHGQGVFIDAGIWTSERFMTGSDVLIVFCSSFYDKTDYIYQKPKIKI